MSESARYEAAKSMGMLFQGSALFDSMPVVENIAFYLREHEPHLAEKEIQDRVTEALGMVGLEGAQQKMPSDLSGGMRKRAALARRERVDRAVVQHCGPRYMRKAQPEPRR